MKIKEIQCKSIIGKCGFPGGGFCINPYVGCGHNCKYCYARFMKRFTDHKEAWGDFVDVKINASEILEKQLKGKNIEWVFIGTVTDAYQPLEKKYQITRKILEILLKHKINPVILTKSDLVLRDLDLLKQFKNPEVEFTIATLDKKWKELTEPFSPSVDNRLKAMEVLSENGIRVCALIGPLWPFLTDLEKIFERLNEAGVKKVFSESVNTIGGNWTDVEKILKSHYPELLPKMKNILFDKGEFKEFYDNAGKKIVELSKKYGMEYEVFFQR